MTFREIVAAIQDTKNEIDLIKSLPSWHTDMQDKIIVALNKQLENKLKVYHKMLMEVEAK